MGTCTSKQTAIVETTGVGKNNQALSADLGTANVSSRVALYSAGQRATSDSSHGKRTNGGGSGVSTPKSMDISNHSTAGGRRSSNNPKTLNHSSSILGLDKLIDDRRVEGDLKNNIVHMEVPFGKPIEEVYDGVHDGPILGSGISGVVRLCCHKATGAKYAVKCLDLDLIESEEGLQQLREEIAIMCQLDHPNIIRLEEVYESHSEIYLVQELCVGGELFDRLDEQPDYHYTEAQCARLVKQMVNSVRYLHTKGIIHRDLKLENFLFSSTNADSELKMIDFGLSKHFKFGDIHHEAVGTPYTVAPEVIRGSYDERCDVWALGVITYLLLSGEPPFGGCGGPETLHQVRSNILRGNFKFEPADVWVNVSDQAKTFIRTLLVTDPNIRPTARDCQESPWLRDWAKKDSIHDTTLNPNVVKALVNFKEYSDMRKLLCEVLSFTLLPDQITDLRKEFEKLDTDGSGEISLAGLKKVLMRGAGSGSLGALTEAEVEDIFHAMRVRKSETRIHWHEFLAAGLSQCRVDGRNLRLAFDRMDSDHKGYITFDNIMDLMGRDALGSEDAMRIMWGDSMKACKAKNAQITYEEFLLLMKGQTKEEKSTSSRGSGKKKSDSRPTSLQSSPALNAHVIGPFTDMSPLNITSEKFDDELALATEKLAKEQLESIPDLPLSPSGDIGRRRRSRSVTDAEDEDDDIEPHFAPDVRRAVLLPEHMHNQKDIESLIKDETKTPLVVNRKLYRAHRQIRLAVLEASKRLEDEQLRRTQAELKAKQDAVGQMRHGAGLVMRHGHVMELSSESVRSIMKQRELAQQKLVETANSRSGRGRRTRIKTISDMSGMLSASSRADNLSERMPATVEETDTNDESSPVINDELHFHETHARATVPGEFRKTVDPFERMGIHHPQSP